jgi:hypothetical protein
LKGAETTLTIRFLTICQTIGPIRNCGSSSVPFTGMSRSITPFASFSSEVANLIGSVTAFLLPVASPHSSWSITMWWSASSARFSMW